MDRNLGAVLSTTSAINAAAIKYVVGARDFAAKGFKSDSIVADGVGWPASVAGSSFARSHYHLDTRRVTDLTKL